MKIAVDWSHTKDPTTRVNRFIILSLTLFTILAIAIPAYALTLPSSLTIPEGGVKVFRNLAQNGDRLYVFEPHVNFTGDAWPDTPASSSIIYRLYDADGTTLKATSSPYVYPYFGSNGYGSGVGSFYFASSDNAPAWGSAAKIEIYGTPAYFSPAQTFSYTLTSNDYIDDTSTEYTSNYMNEQALYNFVLLLSDRLQSDYESTGVILKTSSDAGVVLTSYGELYFKGVIPGIQNLCPDLFYIQVYVPTEMPVSYNMTMQQTYTARHATDEIGEGLSGVGDAMGVSGSFVGAGIVFLITMVAAVVTSRKGWGAEPGLAIGALVGIFFAVTLGNTIFTIMMVFSLVAAIGIVFMFLLKRA